MIVVLIIGILMAIAVPNFIRARENSRTSTCVANLKQIDSAKEQFAMETRLGQGGAAGMGDLSPDYMKSVPTCPSDGTYTVGAIGTNPSCSIGGTHVLP
jgi:Tfp pilus assembly protein PilE